jgi:signal transduction histidine kinase
MSADKANILVVDDGPDKLVVYRSILDDLGHNVITARSGAEALKYVLQRDFAVILLDVHMPDVDGFETANLIRRRKRSAHTPIIFITAMLDEVRAVEGYAHGGVDYILAPVVPEILRAKVKVFIDLFQMHQELKRQAEVQVALAEERARREAAEETDRRKDEFLAMLAHELRNPLAPICNAAHLLRLMLPHDPELTKLQDMIERQLGNLTRLVDDLLDVSRITTGKIRLNMEPIDIASAATIAVETSRPLIDARKQELTVSMPPRPVPVVADQTRLAQVLANLLNNAAKYTHEGGHIGLTIAPEGTEVVCRVRDDGVGIPKAMLPSIFDLFIQAEQSLDRSHGGLGIGLTLARKLVEMHHGSVEALSDGPSLGSEFVVRLPIATVNLQRDIRPGSLVLRRASPSGRRVLVVDDNKDAAQSLAMLLHLDGHEIRTAHDGNSALENFDTFLPNAVFLDLGLPGMDGYEVARRLRETHSLDVLLVAVTGYGSDVDHARSRAAGFNHHLVKPVRPDDIRRLLDESTSLCASES